MDTELLQAALVGLAHRRTEIEQKMDEVRKMLRDGTSGSSATAAPGTKKRGLSAEARQRIGAAQKKRWAAFRRGRAAQNAIAKPAARSQKKAPTVKRVVVKNSVSERGLKKTAAKRGIKKSGATR